MKLFRHLHAMNNGAPMKCCRTEMGGWSADEERRRISIGGLKRLWSSGKWEWEIRKGEKDVVNS